LPNKDDCDKRGTDGRSSSTSELSQRSGLGVLEEVVRVASPDLLVECRPGFGYPGFVDNVATEVLGPQLQGVSVDHGDAVGFGEGGGHDWYDT
jgi:hypothetical protein